MYRGILYMADPLAEVKGVSVSFRVTPHFKRLRKAAAESERGSQTNLLEALRISFIA